jgi:hypothetical protein
LKLQHDGLLSGFVYNFNKRRFTKGCINGIIHASILGIAFPFYLIFAAVGYFQFGEHVSGDLLTEWMGDRVMTIAQVEPDR